MKYNAHTKKGFTLVEALVALVIGLSITGLLLIVLTQGIGDIRDIQNRERMYAQASHVMGELRLAVRKAESFTVTSPTSVEVVTSDGTVTVSKSGNFISLNGAIIQDDPIILQGLYFRKVSDSLEFGISLATSDGEIEWAATTTVSQRNI